MTPTATVEHPPEQFATVPVEPTPGFRLRPVMRQGTASSVPETWRRYDTLDHARRAVKQMYRFVEWVER